MTKIKLGEKCAIDLPRLLETRLLIQANSGGGKSYLLRKFLEETHGKVQQIVLDLEGEFSTLREKYDYLLIGKDGDVSINIKSAELLAKKLLELNVSTIIDLYELKHHERILFVKRFLDSMINSPKELWHHCVVIVDEAHIFCPEKGQAESMPAVIDLMTRGRKRGFCGILATQRLSKLHKDAAAECNNKLMGRTGLDIDMKRVSEELGFTSKADMLSLRDLDAGEFFAFGTAISNKIIKVKIGEVKTTHPRAGNKIIKAETPPTEKIKKLLEKLNDLPQKAEEELRTIEDYKKKLRELSGKLRQKPIPELDEAELAKRIGVAEKRAYASAEKQISSQRAEYERTIRVLQSKVEKIGEIVGQKVTAQKIHRFEVPKPAPTKIVFKPQKPAVSEVRDTEDVQLDRCARAIYSLLASNPDREFSKSLTGVLTGYSHRSGGFNNSISRLRSFNLIHKHGDTLKADSKVLRDDLIDTSQSWDVKSWINKLGKCPKEIFNVIVENPEQEFTKEELGEQTGYSSSSGGFNNAISRLNSLGLIIRGTEGRVRLNVEVLEWL